jgi:hypothetical protein
MTEDDWITATEPHEMLLFLRSGGKGSDRKLRLFAVACCRRIWSLLKDERSRRAVEVAEEFADGAARTEYLTDAYYAANVALLATDSTDQCYHAAASLACHVAYALPLHGCYCTSDAARATADTVADATENAIAYKAARGEELAIQSHILRDIVGNPFRPPPSITKGILLWNGGLIVRMAQAICEDRDFTQESMGVMADGLEEAGVDDASLLEHLRGPGPHCRGCFAIDMLLGKG